MLLSSYNTSSSFTSSSMSRLAVVAFDLGEGFRQVALPSARETNKIERRVTRDENSRDGGNGRALLLPNGKFDAGFVFALLRNVRREERANAGARIEHLEHLAVSRSVSGEFVFSKLRRRRKRKVV